MVAICEGLPELHNTVTLDPDLTDSHGIPAPKIDYTPSENSRNMLDYSITRGTEALTAAGACDIMTDAPISVGNRHLMGTTRMGTEPGNPVVNAWGRSHDVESLFVIDSSLFVTGAGVNPTLTIQAYHQDKRVLESLDIEPHPTLFSPDIKWSKVIRVCLARSGNAQSCTAIRLLFATLLDLTDDKA